MVCLIHEGGDGRLHFDGINPTERDIAAVLGDNPRTIKKLLAELETAGVFSRDQHDFIISRRVIRELEKVERDTRNGRTGGNPALLNKDLAETGVNPSVKAHIPEARSQRPEDKQPITNSPGVVTADAVPPRYAFEGKTIRLNQKNFDQWVQSHPNLSLMSELFALDEWAGQQKAAGKSWFSAVAGALAKKQRDFNERVGIAKANREAGGSPRARPDMRI
ncbi:hypothetical protein IFT84_13120 [Rhizobium sp. CFBP 8762]|uniref:hypothetical protein n=1 Tax=Rhizobium sp. CFBP 8762 TaxID=2775279 RepID=UPI00177C79A5|nr:hypothetical protein [Rhizobium sp. CFBP 8762]MBD8555446.1 hypothetical protein [Rhizobium sp. CFBP 8762]